ncbi:hypothetical protein DPMN_118065 [Dreissena polymorpha]|uniref:Uncharacterized protein n=1 Tax=Dreissena polymorpha TaxID=45954 RepID=A0A9D4GGU4_DREPO|nr:hypothetical protein DPMN_118065 [Dreissena polymorpha]
MIRKRSQMERKKAMQKRKRKAAEEMMEKETASDIDEATVVAPGKCYKCEAPYEKDFIEFDHCFRRIQITCVNNKMIDGVPFECKYC